MASLKALISSLRHFSLQRYKPKTDQCRWISQAVLRNCVKTSPVLNCQHASQTVQTFGNKLRILEPNCKQLFCPNLGININQLRLFYDVQTEQKPFNFWLLHKRGIVKRKRKKNPLGGKPFAKGVILKTLVKKPKKPNSANRKCVLVRLSTGREMTAYIPGEGNNLQEHNIVLVKVARLRDVPGVKLKCVRGAYDLGHVIKRKKA